ncbi:winged helix-turn-helix domain-containing protein [Bailinhaonella thermotolerans]|uniref:GntR family transcriptional regulator n=1 Tax=Bailinhaonella thermotolerans TaxID=1070861 RepID=A0A3A4A620_9ACTN|nr:winged helix-turn-helix domain-containing protein [Bailinhaonella thermotolerans]RJL21093.1 GntR family transcriptional regulator [Bailinhaonella thermotolerans]
MSRTPEPERDTAITWTGRPGYLQIADDLRSRIGRGELRPGQALPSTAQLAARYGTSLGVVKAAVRLLRAEGRLIGQQGKGVFVGDHASAASEAGDDLGRQLADLRRVVAELSQRLAALEQVVRGDDRG